MKHAAAKALRQSRKAVDRNRAAVTALKKIRKEAHAAITDKNSDAAHAALRRFGKAADKAVQKGILKKNTGARLISRLAKAVKALN